MKKLIISLALLLMLVGLTRCSNTSVNTTTNVEPDLEIITVTDKWIKRTNERDLYLIGTEEEVFKIEDNIFVGKLNSSDIYNKIKIGHTYRITTTGMRSSFMSWYRNINTIEEVLEEE